jgi:hypothetical protein
MKQIVNFIAVLLALVVGMQMSFAGEKAPQKIMDLAKTKLAALGVDPVIVAAVKEQNTKGATLTEIRSMDEKWRTTPGIADFMRTLMDSKCGKHLQGLQKAAGYMEMFVMDNQGANVAMSEKTSDYWQGDEAKFIESFKGGKGAIHVSDVEFDDSSQAYLVQVSVPVKDGDKVIGAMTIGIDIEKVQ